MAGTDEWKYRIELSPELLFDGIEWLSDEDKRRGVPQEQRTDKLLMTALCGSFVDRFDSESDHIEAIEHIMDEVIGDYALHLADQELSEMIEVAVQRANDTIAAAELLNDPGQYDGRISR